MRKSNYVFFFSFALSSLLISCKSSTSTNDPQAIQYKNISGTISLFIYVDDSGTLISGTTVDTKDEDVVANLVFTLPVIPLLQSSDGSTCSWKDPHYGGNVLWSEVHTKEYDCSGKRATDYDTTIKIFSSDSIGEQAGIVQFSIQNNGFYGISAAGISTGNPTVQVHSTATNCGTPTYARNTINIPGVPFENYFKPFTNNAKGSLTGTVDKSEPKHIKGTFNGNDVMTLFTQVTIPLNYTIVWDLTMTN